MTETSAPVRVPNVRPNARSGLSGEVIGSDAIAAYEENQRLAANGEPITGEEGTAPDGTEAMNAETGVVSTGGLLPPVPGQDGGSPLVPQGDLDARVAWVAEAEDPDEADARANAVWLHEQETGDLSEEDLEALARRLQEAAGWALVEVPEDATTVDAVLAWVKGEDGEDADRANRARAALLAEEQRPEEDQRKTILDPLRAMLSDPAPGA